MARPKKEESESVEMWAPPPKYHTLKDGYKKKQFEKEHKAMIEEKKERILRGYRKLYEYVSDKPLSPMNTKKIKDLIDTSLL